MQYSLKFILKEGFYVPLSDEAAETPIHEPRSLEGLELLELGPGRTDDIELVPEAANVVLLLDGGLSLSGGRELYPYSAVYYPRNAEVRQIECTAPSHVFVVRIHADLLAAFSRYGPLPKRYVEEGQCGILVKLVMKMLYEHRRDDQFTGLDCYCLTLEMLAQIARLDIERGKQPPPWMGDALRYIHNNYQSLIRLSDVAERVGCSPLEVSRRFRRYHNMNLNMYIRRLRVHHACNKLAKKEPQLADIAHDLGFTDQSHFTKVFKMFTGMTPATYQQHCSRKEKAATQ